MIDVATIKQAASLVFGLYDYVGSPSIDWKHLDTGEDSDKICWAVKEVDGVNFVVLRGSTTMEDWLRDFQAWADPFHMTAIGHVHPGFVLGMEQVWSEVMKFTSTEDLVITGHSLGAARADILTGLMVREGLRPRARIVFGEPKPGFADFAALIGDVPAVSYCCGDDHGHDLVTDVPFSFPPELYVRPTALTSVRGTPMPNDHWGPFRYHHFQLYDAAAQALEV